MTTTKQRPIPQPDELTQPFWDATAQHRLDIQRCQACRYYNHPPTRLCDQCGSPDLAYETVSGRGRIYSYTVMRQTSVAGFEDQVPYTNVLVELEEQPQLLLVSMFPGEASVQIGQPVEVAFEDIGDSMVFPQFRVVG